MSRPVLRASASTTLRPLLGRTGLAGRVSGVFASAVYLELGSKLVALETIDALRLPCAVVLPQAAARSPFASVHAGDAAEWAGNRLAVGPLALEVVRWWQPRRLRRNTSFDDERLELLAGMLPPVSETVAAPLWELRRAAVLGQDVAHGVDRLLGLGGGLTPEGDDVLAGLLVTLRTGGSSQLFARLADTVRAFGPTRTTALSAALLHHAAEGRAVPRLLDVLDALGPGGSDETLRGAVVRLLAVGHTSGTALAHGVLTGATLHRESPSRSEVACA